MSKNEFDKKDYVVSRFRKMAHKKYEVYCISRIIHKLDRIDVEFTTQQLFSRKNGKRALADLYFPQLNWSVEIDENYHVNNKEADKKRTEDIKADDELIRKKLNSLEEIVDTPIEEIRIAAGDDKTIEDINAQCDDVVDKLKRQIDEMGDEFVPWSSPYSDKNYGKKHQILRVCDNVRYKTMRSAGISVFNKSLPSGGSWFPLVKEEGIYLWFPKLKLEGEEVGIKYTNTYSIDGKYIFESSDDENDKFVQNALVNRCEEIRYVFPGYKDYLGKKMYKFKGVYKINVEYSKKENKVVWERVSLEVDLKKFFL